MAVLTKWRIFIIVAIINCNNVESSQDIMKSMTGGFAKVLRKCQSELNLGDEIIQEFYNYWREDFQMVNQDMGCMILCMGAKLELINVGDVSLHHGNLYEFAKTHGAGDDVARQLVSILQDCDKSGTSESDDCARLIVIAQCFKTKMHDLKWAPPIEVILEEVMIFV